MTAVLSSVLGLFLVVALSWKAYQLSRAPHDGPLRAVTLCLACAAVAFPFGVPAGARAFDGLVGDGGAKLVQNIMLLCCVYWLMCFYLYSASDPRRGHARARREAVPLGVATAVITLATVLTPQDKREHVYATADMQVTGVALFYLVGGLYLGYALSMALWWTRRYARISRGPLATGLRLTALSMAAMVLADAAREVFTVIRWSGATVPPALISGAGLVLSLAIPLFVIGVSYPGIATRLSSLRLWWYHRRVYHRLHPLWTALHQAFPEDELSRVPASRWGDALRVRGVHRRYYRRVIECRDGLVRISPYLTRPAAPDGPVQETWARDLAAQLRNALRAHAAGGEAPSQAAPVALPQEETLDADARQLVALSDAFQAAP